MNRTVLLGYQLATGLSDTVTGALLMIAPELTLRLMMLHVANDSIPFLSFIGAFVLSVGLACLYGGLIVTRGEFATRLGVVWLLTAITRGSVAMFVIAAVAAGRLETGWLTVAACDGVCVLIQATGLRRGWLLHVAG
jgi:hypothetical protein